MANTKLSDLTELAAVPADGDLFEVVDISDTTMAATGTNKKIQFSNLGFVPKTLFDANTILIASTDDTPAALAVGASTIVGRKATGGIVALTISEAKSLLAIDHGADLTGLGDDDHSQYIYTTPAADSRNVIQPAGAGIKGLVLKGFTGQSDNLLEVQNDSTVVLALINSLGGFTFNESGADTDCRIEGDNQANLFVTDASVDKIGMGIAAPLETLHLARSANLSTNAVGIVLDDTSLSGNKLTISNDQIKGPVIAYITDSANLSTINLASARWAVGSFGQAFEYSAATAVGAARTWVTALWMNTGRNGTAGVVGVGVFGSGTAPSGQLHVKAAASTTLATVIQGAASQSANLTNWLDSSSNILAVVTKDGGFIFNEQGADIDCRIEGDTDANLFYTDASVDRIGIGTSAPTAKLDLNSDVLRVRTAKTPSSAGDTGNAGDICWDSGFVYVCTATNTWKRAAIATW